MKLRRPGRDSWTRTQALAVALGVLLLVGAVGLWAANRTLDSLQGGMLELSRALHEAQASGSWNRLVATQRHVLSETTRGLRTVDGLVLALVLGVGALVAVVAAGILRPLGRVRRVAEAFAAGDFTARVAEAGPPEIRQLAASINTLGRTIHRHDEDLNQALDEAARQRDVFYSIINAASDGLLLYNAHGRIVAANQRCAELLGIPYGDLLTKEAREIQDAVESRSVAPELYREKLGAHFATPDATHQDRLELREPKRRVLRRVSRPFFEHGVLAGRVFTYTDITVETDLDRMKSEFVSTASHELRTPLTSIRGALQLALAGSGDRLAPEDQELLQISLASTERLVRLVNDLLDLSKIEAGRMPLDKVAVDPRQLLEETARTMQGLAAQRAARITIEALPGLPPVLADHDHLMRVMTNLVSNALKYAPERSEVRLHAAPQAEGIEFRVDDQGPGIAPAHMPRLFRPFCRVGLQERQATGGTGLGLAISRAIVEQHSGRIWVERLEPHGTRFAFLLPYPERPPHAETAVA